jgi:hypothetical protein
MLILLPVLLPILASIVILVVQRFQPRFGLSYLLAIIASLGNLGIILSFHWNAPAPLALANWLPFPGLPGAIIFQLDTVSWPYTIAITSLTAAVILTASGRLGLKSVPTAWAGSLLVSGTAILAIIASSPLALALSWTLIDLIELSLILGTVNKPQMGLQAVLSFSARLAGTFFLIIAMAISQANGQALILVDPPATAGIYLLIAAGLRLGVLPLHLPYTTEVPLRRGLGTMLRLASPASSLVLLGHLPVSVVPPEVSDILLIFAALAGLYGAAMWLASENETIGRPYWMIGLAGMCIASVIRGYPLASLAWGTTLILSGGALFLYSARERLTILPPLLSLLAFTGLPFTQAASGWSGLIIPPINAPDLIFLAAHVLLVIGFIRHALKPGEQLSSMERWIHVVYPAGLFLLAITSLMLAFIGWPQSLTVGNVWASAISFLLALAFGIWYVRYRPRLPEGQLEKSWWVILFSRLAGALSVIFRLDWLYRFLGVLVRLAQRIFEIVSGLLEGEGGLLWVFVLLALLLSLISGITP